MQESWAGRGSVALGFGAMSQPLARSLRCAGPAFRHSFVPSVLGFPALLGEEHGVHMAC